MSADVSADVSAGVCDVSEVNPLCVRVGQNVALVNDMQKVIPQLQAECEKLQVTSRNLHEDNRLTLRHIEVNPEPGSGSPAEPHALCQDRKLQLIRMISS